MSTSSRPPRDGAFFPFKIQKIIQPRIRSRESLPEPPKGMAWEQDPKTKAWKLIPSNQEKKNKTLQQPQPQQQLRSQAPNKIVINNSKTKEPVGAKVVVETPVEERIVEGLCFAAAEEKLDDDDEWDMLSEQISTGSLGGAVIVTRSGSVRSLGSVDNSANLSLPIKVQRTLSSSTIDTVDGDKTLGIRGVDYVEHIVLPSDTIQGVCLAYKISLTRLRQVNQFSGNSLSSAPKKLIIPMSKKAVRSGFIHVQDTDSREYKKHALMAEVSTLKETEAVAYLELADWDLEEAVRSASEDNEWDRAEDDDDDDKSTDIRITVKLQGGIPVDFSATGVGLRPQLEQPQQQDQPNDNNKSKVAVFDGVPAIATKSVRPQDVYNAASQHEGFGVELKPIPKEQ